MINQWHMLPFSNYVFYFIFCYVVIFKKHCIPYYSLISLILLCVNFLYYRYALAVWKDLDSKFFSHTQPWWAQIFRSRSFLSCHQSLSNKRETLHIRIEKGLHHWRLNLSYMIYCTCQSGKVQHGLPIIENWRD